ncbi:MAG: ABC transporter permease [Candidatus Lokiarchaeota archaeon]|nr:ABC transporter permease [Candidatus Lokiarchaeota archaeon]
MSRFWSIAVKNLKSIYRDKKSWLFILLIPIFYYTLMGLLFGGRVGSDFYIYSVGFVNLDTNTMYSNQANYNLAEIYAIIEETEAFNMGYYSDTESALTDLENEDIDAIVQFQERFQEYLNTSSQKKYAFYDNDSTTAHISNVTHSIDYFINVASSYLNITNITSYDFASYLANFSNSEFQIDFVILFEQGFEQNLDLIQNASYTLYYRNGTSKETLEIQNAILTDTIKSIMLFEHTPKQSSNIISTTQMIIPSEAKFQIAIQFYFRDSTDITVKQIIKGTMAALLNGIINYDPTSIDITYEDIPISGKVVSWLTQGTPGYLMYGMLSLLSMATILITDEKKSGTLKRLESSQMRPIDMLFGHIISNTAIVITQFLIGLGVLAIFGFRPVFANLWSLILGTLITVLLASFFLNALSLVAAAIFKTPDASAGGVWLILIPLMTFSGAFFPLEAVAPVLVPYTSWIPTRIVVLLLQDLMVDGIGLSDPSIWINYSWLMLWGGAMFTLGAILYRRFAQS